MCSISAKIWLSLAALLVFLSSCSRESPEPVWEAQSTFGNEYNGGLFPVNIALKEPVTSVNSISWRTRYANIAYRNQERNSKGQIITDTAFIYWETPPPLFEKYDSTEIKKDTTVSWKIDTTRYYRDTIFAIVNYANRVEESSPIIVDVKNILPRIKSISVGGISQPVDSLLTITANLGDTREISIILEKPFKNPFNKAFHSIITMPPLMGNPTLRRQENDSTFVYEWTVPTREISDSSGYLKIEDTGGYGERLYKVHLVVYTEIGSVWVASNNELVKYSPKGTEVARISNNFDHISDISINRNIKKLFVVDESTNSFFIFDNYGNLLNQNTSEFNSPSGIAVDLEGKYVWVADAEDPVSALFRLRRYALVANELKPTSAIYENELSAPINGLSINQFQSDLVWFTIPKSNKVGYTYTIEPPEFKFIEPKFTSNEPSSSSTIWNRPSAVSLDPRNGIAWIADSSKVYAIDTSGNVLAYIRPFNFVTSVSANNGNVWVSDKGDKKVYLFKGPFTGSMQDIDIAPSARGKYVESVNFRAPISVSAYTEDGGVWVIDEEAGMAVRLDSLGNKISSGTGLKLPILGKTVQIVE